MIFLRGLLGLGWLRDAWGILGILRISLEFYGYLGLCGKAPSLTSSFLAFPSQDLPGANVFSIFFPFYRGKPLQNRSAPHFIEGLPSFPITDAHAFLFYRGKPFQNRSVPHFIERLSEVFFKTIYTNNLQNIQCVGLCCSVSPGTWWFLTFDHLYKIEIPNQQLSFVTGVWPQHFTPGTLILIL